MKRHFCALAPRGLASHQLGAQCFQKEMARLPNFRRNLEVLSGEPVLNALYPPVNRAAVDAEMAGGGADIAAVGFQCLADAGEFDIFQALLRGRA